MPDPVAILEAIAAAALTAAAVLWVCAWPGRTPHSARASAGGVLGVGLGFWAGCWLLGVRPHWPPQEDQDRWLLLLLPALIGVELLATVSGRSRWLVWPLRLVIATGAARVLLHQTSYLTDLAGPDTREWTLVQTWLILGGLAVALAGVWTALVWLMRPTALPLSSGWRESRAKRGSVLLALAATCGGAAITVMLSGYASGGQLGLPLAAALTGAAIVALVLPVPPDMDGVLGLGVVGLFALLVIGRFFGQLATDFAALLFFAPLLGWFVELPYARRMGPWFRGVTRVFLTAIPVAFALLLAQQKFAGDARRTAPAGQEPSVQDYLDYGK